MNDACGRCPLVGADVRHDPSPKADVTRGTTTDALVESIDLLPTFVDFAGGDSSKLNHILEGHSLLPLLRGGPAPARDYTICEYDYSAIPLAAKLGLDTRQSRMFMVADHDWKMIHFESGHRPMLFDLQGDPKEVNDLGGSADHADIIARMYAKLNSWARRPSARTTRSNASFINYRTNAPRSGVLIGIVDATETTPDKAQFYVGRKAENKRGKPDQA